MTVSRKQTGIKSPRAVRLELWLSSTSCSLLLPPSPIVLTLISGYLTDGMLTCSIGEQKRTKDPSSAERWNTFSSLSLAFCSRKNSVGLWGSDGVQAMRTEGEIKTEDKNKSHRGAQANYHFEQLTRFPGKCSSRKISAGRGMVHRTSQSHIEIGLRMCTDMKTFLFQRQCDSRRPSSEGMCVFVYCIYVSYMNFQALRFFFSIINKMRILLCALQLPGSHAFIFPLSSFTLIVFHCLDPLTMENIINALFSSALSLLSLHLSLIP